jgi:hypothetical protein
MDETVPATLRRYRLDRDVLVETGELLQEAGQEELESVVVWVGRIVDDETAEVLSPLRPRQICFRTEDGVGVEVPPDAISELISALPQGMFVLARVHSHPGAAYHSPVDDTNMLIAHQGAISIVVPNFAADPIALERCSVNELRHGEGWIELSSWEVGERFEVR